MLQKLRDKTTGWIAFVIVGLLIIPFAFFGVEQFFTQSAATYIAKVNDVEIGQDAFRARFDQFRMQMRQAMGDRFDPIEFEKPESKRLLLERMIDEEVLRQAGQRLGAAVPASQLQSEIMEVEEFKVDGRFDPATYRMILANNNLSPRGYEDRIRESLEIGALVSPLQASGFVTDDYVSRYLALRDQTRDFRYIELPAPAPESAGEVTDAQIQAYYDENTQRFVSEETVALEYVEIDASKLDVPVVADESTLRQRYEEQKSRFIEAEQRLASHILIEVPADADADVQKAALTRAQEIAAQARAEGADFAALAKANSQDAGSSNTGGDLGWIEREITEPAFETALFAMQSGTISDPVKTSNGWHVIQLREVREETGKQFEAVRAELEREYLDTERERLFSDLAGQLVDVVYRDPSTLATASDELKLPVQRSESFSRAGGAGIASNPEVLRVAFSDAVLIQGSVSDPIEIEPGRTVAIRVVDHVPAAPKPLDVVRDEVRASLIAERIAQNAKQAAEAALASLAEGGTLEDLAAAQELEVKTAEKAGRFGAAVAPAISQEAFTLPHPAAGETSAGMVETGAGVYAILQLTAVTDGDPETTPSETRKMLGEQLANAIAGVEAKDFVQALRKSADITVVEDRM